MAHRYQLVIGTKTWSSWSFRPWLLMREFSLPFDETVIALRRPETASEIERYSPSGKVPVLIDRSIAGGLAIWDTLAIVEHLADRHQDIAIWPRDPAARAIARSVSAEMHSGFAPLRQNCPMDFNARGLAPADSASITGDIRRIIDIWTDCRARFGAAGPFLFGAFSAADAMFAPVISRFTSYQIGALSELVGKGAGAEMGAVAVSPYIDAVRGLAGWSDWSQEAAAETLALS